MQMKEPRVALLSYDWGEYCIRLASALAQEVNVCLLLANQLAEPHLPLLSRRVDFQPFFKPRLRHPVRQIVTIITLLQRIHTFNPDVIHIQQGHFWFNLALPSLKRYPLVFTIHDPKHHYGDRGAQKTPQHLFNFGFRHADRIIVQAEQLKQVVVDELSIPEGKVHVISHIALGNPSIQDDVEEDDCQILFFGRIWPYKGLEYLIRAEPLITECVPDVKIVIAGEGEAFARYRRLMVHPERFIVHNEYVSNKKRAELFRRASVVVLPYVEATQSGIVPLAYNFAKPVVATNVGGLPDAVDDGETGYLVPPRNEEALANAIIRLLQDKSLRRQLGVNGKRKIESEQSPEVIARRTLTVYERALDQRSTGQSKKLRKGQGSSNPGSIR